MHIAICDDNVADRKHLERLLSRESDKRAGSPNILYVDSYGKKENLLVNPHKYDLFIIDMVASPTIARETVLELKRLKVTAPIVMFSSTIDHTLDENIPADVVHYQKPYVPAPLQEILKLGDEHVMGTVISILATINGIKQPVAVNDIYYAYAEDNKTRLVLKDQTTFLVEEKFIDIYNSLEPYEEFYYLKKNVLINVKYTSLITYISVMMQDYKEFYFNPFKRNELLELKAKIDSY